MPCAYAHVPQPFARWTWIAELATSKDMLRVLVAEDSATARLLIASLLSSDPEISVVGQARNGEEAVALCGQLRPDVITMDIQMPVMDGLEATREIVAQWRTPVIMVSSLDPADVSRSMLAYNAGALAVLAKPSGPGTPRFEKDCRDLIATVKALSEAKPDVTAPISPSKPVSSHKSEPVEILGLVASTGGPIALRAFFKALPAKFDLPIVIVQHIASGFAGAFAGWLASATGRNVRLATDQDRIQRGVVYVVSDDRAVEFGAGSLHVRELDGVSAGTAMLTSLARTYGARAAGAILTGIGTDGVDGLRALHENGAPTFVQDEASCTAAETPRAALDAGIVEHPTPLAEIAHRVVALSVASATPD